MSIDQDIANSAKQLDIDVRINHQITNGDENTEVATKGGKVPSIRKRLKDIEGEWAKTADPLANDLAQSVQLAKEYQYKAAEQADLSKQEADASAKHAMTASECSDDAVSSAKLAAEELPKVIAEGAKQVEAILDAGQRQVGLVTDTGAQQTADVKAYADKAEDAKNLAELAETNSKASALEAAQDATVVSAIAEKFDNHVDQAIAEATEQADIAIDAAEKSEFSEARSLQNANHAGTAADQAKAFSESSSFSANVSEISASNASEHRTAAEKAQIKSELASADCEEAKIKSETAASQSVTHADHSRQSADTSSTQADRAESEADRAESEADRAAIAGEASHNALNKTSNLADLADKAESRFNLDVYSKVETDDKIDSNYLLPDQTGNSGKLLGTNGTATEWVESPETLPYQLGHDGKFLQTDGLVATWQIIPVINHNLLINGDFYINQRNINFTESGYTSDRWYVDNVVRVKMAEVSENYIASQMTLTAMCSSWINGIKQSIFRAGERLHGKQITVSALVKGPSGKTTKIAIEKVGESGVFTFTGKWQQIAHTFTIPHKTEIFIRDLVVCFHKDCTARANEYVSLTDAKVEIGNIITPFVVDDFAENMAKCQKYYYQLGKGDYLGVASGQSGNIRYFYRHPVEMVRSPRLTVSGNILTRLGGNNTNSSSAKMTASFTDTKWISITIQNSYSASYTAPWGMVEGTIKVDAEVY